MIRKSKDTPEEAMVREQLEAKGIKGMSPALALQIPKEDLAPLVTEGLSDYEICVDFDVSYQAIAKLRKLYDLPTKSEVKKMLACVEPEPEDTFVRVEPDEVLEIDVKLNHDGTLTEVESFTGKVAKKEPDDDTRYSVTELGEEVAKANPAILKQAHDSVCPADCKGNPMQEGLTSNPPLLDIENEADTITPLLQGIAKYLERLGKEKVQVVVTVRKV